MSYFLGIDVGSVTTKAVILDESKNLCAWHSQRTGAQVKSAIDTVLQTVCEKHGISLSDAIVVATGYGRKQVSCAQETVTEITAHGRGAQWCFPDTRCVVDIGGQDSKVIMLDPSGAVADFVMNDKCSAGTGRFLESMAHILEVPIEELGRLAHTEEHQVHINSTCTVFAESEVISLIARAASRESIAYAIHSSVVDRMIDLIRKLPISGIITMSGGVSKNDMIRHLIQERLQVIVHVPEYPHLIGAIGAALSAV